MPSARKVPRSVEQYQERGRLKDRTTVMCSCHRLKANVKGNTQSRNRAPVPTSRCPAKSLGARAQPPRPKPKPRGDPPRGRSPVYVHIHRDLVVAFGNYVNCTYAFNTKYGLCLFLDVYINVVCHLVHNPAPAAPGSCCRRMASRTRCRPTLHRSRDPGGTCGPSRAYPAGNYDC